MDRRNEGIDMVVEEQQQQQQGKQTHWPRSNKDKLHSFCSETRLFAPPPRENPRLELARVARTFAFLPVCECCYQQQIHQKCARQCTGILSPDGCTVVVILSHYSISDLANLCTSRVICHLPSMSQPCALSYSRPVVYLLSFVIFS